jgi:DNA repair protein RadC
MPKPKLQPSLFDQGEITQIAESPGVASLRETSKALRAIELICAVTGLNTEQAGEVLKRTGSAHHLARLPEHALMSLPHIGQARARQLKAMTEWALVLSEAETTEPPQIRSPADAANLVMLEMGLLEREELRVMGLDTKNKVSFVDTIYQGSLNTAVVRIAEVLRTPIVRQCAGMILVHNHPSGDPTPSPEDVRVTEMIQESSALFDIKLLDHLIIGLNRFVSMKERGLGFK